MVSLPWTHTRNVFFFFTYPSPRYLRAIHISYTEMNLTYSFPSSTDKENEIPRNCCSFSKYMLEVKLLRQIIQLTNNRVEAREHLTCWVQDCVSLSFCPFTVMERHRLKRKNKFFNSLVAQKVAEHWSNVEGELFDLHLEIGLWSKDENLQPPNQIMGRLLYLYTSCFT